jgi:hypothetical protein
MALDSPWQLRSAIPAHFPFRVAGHAKELTHGDQRRAACGPARTRHGPLTSSHGHDATMTSHTRTHLILASRGAWSLAWRLSLSRSFLITPTRGACIPYASSHIWVGRRGAVMLLVCMAHRSTRANTHPP